MGNCATKVIGVGDHLTRLRRTKRTLKKDIAMAAKDQKTGREGSKLELVSLKSLDFESRVLLLEELGYTTDGEFVRTEEGDVVVDRYTDQPVRVENMAILPGSTIVLDDNPYSIAAYLDEFGNRVASSPT